MHIITNMSELKKKADKRFTKGMDWYKLADW